VPLREREKVQKVLWPVEEQLPPRAESESIKPFVEKMSRQYSKRWEYWPPGSAFCIFFGPTPSSHGDEIRAASPVNVIGELKGDWSGLWDVNSGDSVVVEVA
jgi:hypothetical protein